MKLSKKELAALSRIEDEKAFFGDPLLLAHAYRKLEEENEALRKCLQSARGYLDPSPIIQKKIDALLTKEQSNVR